MTTAAFHTTPTEALERIVGLLPIGLHVELTATNSRKRMIDQGTWLNKLAMDRRAHTDYLNHRSSTNMVLAMPSDKTEECAISGKRYRIQIPSRNDASVEPHGPKRTTVYTDGSRTSNSSGAGFIIYKENATIERSIPMGECATINQAEMLAILQATQELTDAKETSKNVTIYSDSQACLIAMKMGTTTSKLTAECHLALNRLGRSNDLLLTWVPGHSDIDGNETADKLAKQGATTAYMGPEPALPISDATLKRKNHANFRARWNENWKTQPACRQSRETLTKAPESYDCALDLPRLRLRHLVTGYTGHGNLGHHLWKMGINSSPHCLRCNAEDEDAHHHIARCPAYIRQRLQHFSTPMLDTKWTTFSPLAVSKYLESTKRLSELHTEEG